MDNRHNSLNLAAKICSDICPRTLSVPSVFSRQMKAIVYLFVYSIDYSKRRAKANREEEERMQKKYQDAQVNFEKNLCVETRKVLEECKMNLERFMIRKLKV